MGTQSLFLHNSCIFNSLRSKLASKDARFVITSDQFLHLLKLLNSAFDIRTSHLSLPILVAPDLRKSSPKYPCSYFWAKTAIYYGVVHITLYCNISSRAWKVNSKIINIFYPPILAQKRQICRFCGANYPAVLPCLPAVFMAGPPILMAGHSRLSTVRLEGAFSRLVRRRWRGLKRRWSGSQVRKRQENDYIKK